MFNETVPILTSSIKIPAIEFVEMDGRKIYFVLLVQSLDGRKLSYFNFSKKNVDDYKLAYSALFFSRDSDKNIQFEFMFNSREFSVFDEGQYIEKLKNKDFIKLDFKLKHYSEFYIKKRCKDLDFNIASVDGSLYTFGIDENTREILFYYKADDYSNQKYFLIED